MTCREHMEQAAMYAERIAHTLKEEVQAPDALTWAALKRLRKEAYALTVEIDQAEFLLYKDPTALDPGRS